MICAPALQPEPARRVLPYAVSCCPRVGASVTTLYLVTHAAARRLSGGFPPLPGPTGASGAG
eukprot:8051106-Alexandrium_andersonii.AAC.1